MEDLYHILGVSADATADEIKQRFLFLAQAYHPDKFTGDEYRKQAEEVFKNISAAYYVLSDPAKKEEYDRKRLRAISYRHIPEPEPPFEGSFYRPDLEMTPKTSQAKGLRLLILISAAAIGATALLIFWSRSVAVMPAPSTFPAETLSFSKTPMPIPSTPTAEAVTPPATLTVTAVPATLPPTTLGAITINDQLSGRQWEISIEKILFADELKDPFLGNEHQAQGRFAIVFIQISNRSAAQSSFCACFEFSIHDGEGRVSEIDLSDTKSAQAIYGLNSGEIEPGGVLHTLMVFDITRQSSYYVLTPNSPYQSDVRGLLLKIP